MFSLREGLSLVGKFTLIACAVIVSIFIVYNIATIAYSKEKLRSTLSAVGLEGAATSRVLQSDDDGFDVTRVVLQDHNNLVYWALGCAGAKTIYGLPMRINQYIYFGSTQAFSSAEGLPSGMRELTNEEKQLLTLNKMISNQRVALKSQADDAYSWWATTTIITILLGMATTILVSASSTEFGRGDGSAQKLIRVLAIIFPAMGTAAAAIIAFYSPQAAWTQTSRTVASLTQLHTQMSMNILTVNCAANEAGHETALKPLLSDWSRRYVDIQTLSVAASGTSNSGSTGAAGNSNDGKPSSPGSVPPG